MVKIQVSQGKAETTVNTNNVWDRIVALENGVTVPTSAALNLKADKTALDATNAQLADIVQQMKWLTYDLKALGCKGDGSNEYSTIASIISSMPNGATLHIPDGTFDLGGNTLTINKPMYITGSGTIQNGKITLSQTSGIIMDKVTTNSLYVTLDTVSNIRITNNSFGNLTKDAKGFISISTNCSDIKIKNNKLHDFMYVTSRTTYACGIKLDLNGNTLSDIEISDNEMWNIHGAAGIWVGGTNLTVNRLLIQRNHIHQTEAFGIEFFYSSGTYTFTDSYVDENILEDCGILRASGTSASGSGGIYGNGKPNVHVRRNTVRRVTECGIEGTWASLIDNYIEDTGCDQLNHPIADSSGIYTGGTLVKGNTVVNPGHDGGVNDFQNDKVDGRQYINNTIKNVFNSWTTGTTYNVGDIVVSNGNWYICKTAGTSGATAPTGQTGGISDGVCTWDYKKPFATTGITLNGANGVQNLSVLNNQVINFGTFLYLSTYIRNITVQGNYHILNDNVTFVKFIDGVGHAGGTNISVQAS